jgi:allantoinase
MIDLCREYRCPVHVVHLSAAEAARPLIARVRDEGVPLTVETCPHYLYFSARDAADGDPRFKCAPPIRDLPQRTTLIGMVIDRWIDTIGSDHSPAPPAMKHLADGDLHRAWGGIASLQLLLPAVRTAFAPVRGRERVFEALTARPAKLAGVAARKGAIAAGRDADLVVFDPDAEFTVTEDMLHHRHKATPYLGRTLRGVVETTYLRGRTIYDRGRVVAEPGGQLLRRSSS